MLKKLRLKFVISATISVIAVIAVILGMINIMNYRKVLKDADRTLSMLADNNGKFPEIPQRIAEGVPERSPDTSGGIKENPEAPFEARYFSILFDREKKIIRTDLGKIAAIDEETARHYGERVVSGIKKTGFVEDYRYRIAESKGKILVIFLDCKRPLELFRTFMMFGIIVAVVGVTAFFLLVIAASGKVMAPFSENYEKQKRFITDAGHEIKTPLTIIRADAEILEMDLGKENEWVQDIQKQTDRLKNLTNDLVFLAKMEEAQKAIQIAEFPLSEIAGDLVCSFANLAKIAGKEIEADIEPNVSYYGDSKNVERLLSILLDNALKYSTESGKIHVLLKKTRNAIEIQVKNTADHFRQDELAQLFDRFYRRDKSRNSETGGYGIGLSIAKAIVTAHKGKITASFKEGDLLVITVILPINK